MKKRLFIRLSFSLLQQNSARTIQIQDVVLGKFPLVVGSLNQLSQLQRDIFALLNIMYAALVPTSLRDSGYPVTFVICQFRDLRLCDIQLSRVSRE